MISMSVFKCVYVFEYVYVCKGLFTYYVSQNQGFLDPHSPLSAIVSIWLTHPLRHIKVNCGGGGVPV